MATTFKRIRDLQADDIVLGETGTRRTVTRLPRACRAPGYVYVSTDGEPINTHGDTRVRVEVR